MTSNLTQKDAPFLTRFGASLRSFARSIRSEEPQYVVAMTRKAPRLLELCDLWGIDYGNAEILTEKALVFIDESKLKGKTVFVIDDIVILGSTLGRLLKKHHYLQSASVICLSSNNKWFTPELVPNIKIKLKLSQHMASVFCNDLVQSIAYLNKPYDLDHPILYGNISTQELSDLCKTMPLDNSYEISSSFHRSIGMRRFSFIPDSSITYSLTNTILRGGESCLSQICKCRLFFNEDTEKANLVPIQIINAKVSDLLSGKLSFSENFEGYNKFIFDIIPENGKEKDLARFTIFNYVFSYLTGIAFGLRNANGKAAIIPSSPPSEFLDYRDLCYLFGSKASSKIIKGLDSLYPKTVELFQAIKPAQPYLMPLTTYATREPDNKEEVFDSKALKLLNKISPFLEKHLTTSEFLVDQLACIFEAMLYRIEIPARDRIARKKNLVGELHRLAKGFSYQQLRKILIDYGALNLNDPNIDVRLSLAIDWLVDCGVIVPIYAEPDGNFGRTYRYGEDGLCQQKFAFLIATVMRDLHNHAHQYRIPKISLEKILVLLARKIGKSQQDIATLQPEPGMTKTLDLKLGYCIHGAIQSVEYSADTGLPGSRWLSDWCEKRKIIEGKDIQKGFVYNSDFFRIHPKENSMVSETLSSKYSMLAKVLWYIDTHVDPSEDHRYLITLSTCHEDISTLEAMRIEIRYLFETRDDEEELFLVGDGYNLDRLLNGRLFKLAEYLAQDDSENVGNLFNLCKQRVINADQASNSILSKHSFYLNRLSTIDSIKSHFDNEQSDNYISYYQNQLLDLVNEIEEIASSEPNVGVDEAIEKLNEYGKLCVNVCSILKLALSISKSYVAGHISKNGKLYKQTENKINRELIELRDAVDCLNKEISNSRSRYPGRSLAELSKMGSSLLMDEEMNKTRWAGLLTEITKQLARVWTSLRSIYIENYSDIPWKKNIILLRPEDTSISPFKWVLWYDIKDSQGRRNPANTEKTPKLKEKINEDLKKAVQVIHDGRYTQDKNDEKFVHTVKPEPIVRILQMILDAADTFGMFLRIGIAGVDDTNIPFLKVNGTDFLESEKTFALPKRLGTCISDDNKVNQLKEYTSEAVNVKKETDDSHTVIISNEAYRSIWNRELPVPGSIRVGYPIDGTKEYTFHILQGVSRGSRFLAGFP